jgi:tetratricopeptide (TPR) repeat protein
MNRIIGRAALRLALFSFGACLWGQSEDLAREAQRAKALMTARRFEEAIPIYQRISKALPGNTGILLDLALAEHMAGREREAISHLEAVLKAQPNHIPALTALAQARLSLGEPKLAIAPLEKVLAAEPKNREVRGTLAAALLDAGRFEEAAARYREVSNEAPNDARAWYGLGMSYQGLASSAFDRLQKLDPTSPYVAALVGDTRVKRRQYRSAFFFYTQALEKLPNLHGVHAALADVYRKTGHPDWAAQEDAKEAALPADDCKTHPAACEFLAGHDAQLTKLPKGAALSAEVLFWQAKAANELALQSFFRLGQLPPSVELHELKADIARGQGQHLEAAQEWRAALALAPGDPRIEQEIAVSHFLAGDYRNALEQASKLLEKNPRSAELHFIAGDSLLRLEDAEKALPHLRAALAADPRMLAADASLGLALARVGKSAEAVPHLEKALELDDDGSLHFQLANAYRASGNAAKAAAAMAKYQEIVKRNEEQKAEVAREAQIAPPK